MPHDASTQYVAAKSLGLHHSSRRRPRNSRPRHAPLHQLLGSLYRTGVADPVVYGKFVHLRRGRAQHRPRSPGHLKHATHPRKHLGSVIQPSPGDRRYLGRRNPMPTPQAIARQGKPLVDRTRRRRKANRGTEINCRSPPRKERAACGNPRRRRLHAGQGGRSRATWTPADISNASAPIR